MVLRHDEHKSIIQEPGKFDVSFRNTNIANLVNWESGKRKRERERERERERNIQHDVNPRGRRIPENDEGQNNDTSKNRLEYEMEKNYFSHLRLPFVMLYMKFIRLTLPLMIL